jgi:hypothetical protein
MNQIILIYPMFAMVVLTFIVLITLFRNRVQYVRKGEISPFYYKTYQGEVEPDKLLKLSQHVTNIFEASTLFYAACLAAMIISEQSMLFLYLAWAYVLLRAAHACIHVSCCGYLTRTLGNNN